jgi:hypothetical protein
MITGERISTLIEGIRKIDSPARRFLEGLCRQDLNCPRLPSVVFKKSWYFQSVSIAEIKLKGLSPEQIDRLLPEGLISLCWRGSVAHGMYVPKSVYYSGGYMGEKRRELVRRVGYDAKNAAHLIRLLRMGIEFLTEGTLHVERADAAELLTIKRGEWPLEQVKTEAERLFQLSQEAYVRSSLPAEPDRDRAERVCIEMISGYHSLAR